jgi:hypothetical protein
MQPEPDSIFDEHFLSEVLIQRRRLMPFALKMYIWLFMIFSGIGMLLPFSGRLMSFSVWRMIADIISPVFMSFAGIVLSGSIFLLNLFIWLEKKWSILSVLVVKGFVTLILFITGFPFTDGVHPFYRRFDVWEFAIVIPYLVMLWQIKDKWEKGIKHLH